MSLDVSFTRATPSRGAWFESLAIRLPRIDARRRCRVLYRISEASC
jgi:hypothetical protein